MPVIVLSDIFHQRDFVVVGVVKNPVIREEQRGYGVDCPVHDFPLSGVFSWREHSLIQLVIPSRYMCAWYGMSLQFCKYISPFEARWSVPGFRLILAFLVLAIFLRSGGWRLFLNWSGNIDIIKRRVLSKKSQRSEGKQLRKCSMWQPESLLIFYLFCLRLY